MSPLAAMEVLFACMSGYHLLLLCTEAVEWHACDTTACPWHDMCQCCGSLHMAALFGSSAIEISHASAVGALSAHTCASLAGIETRDMLRVVQAKGAGYALSKQEELETMQHVAHATGSPLHCITQDHEL